MLDNQFDDIFRPIILAEQDVLEMENSSIGGFTAFNKSQYKVKTKGEKIKCYDINSFYPAIMSEPLPCGLPKNSNKGMKNPITWYRCRMTYCQWISKYAFISRAPLPSNFTEENFYLVSTHHDFLKNVVDWDLEILDVWYQETTTCLQTYIAELYLKKSTLTDKDERYNTKILLNSLYGKLLERTYTTEKVYVKDSFVKKPVSKVDRRCILTGVYVVQIGQMILIRTLMDEVDQGNIFLYSDTDSLKIVENKPPLFFIDQKIMGAWKLEGCYDLYMNNGKAKKYYLRNTKKNEHILVMSGVKNNIREKLSNVLSPSQIELLYEVDNNVLLVDAANDNMYSALLSQILIKTTTTQFNKYPMGEDRITHILDFNHPTKLIRKTHEI